MLIYGSPCLLLQFLGAGFERRLAARGRFGRQLDRGAILEPQIDGGDVALQQLLSLFHRREHLHGAIEIVLRAA